MKLSINVKPQKIVVKSFMDSGNTPIRATKQELLDKIIKPQCGRWADNKNVRAYNLEKHNRVLGFAKKKKGQIKQDRVVVTPNHWVAYVYDFDVQLLYALKLKVEQGLRTFKLVSTQK